MNGPHSLVSGNHQYQNTIPVYHSVGRRPTQHGSRNIENLVRPPINRQSRNLPTIFCSNAQSVRYKMNDLATSVQLLKADIVCIVETWLNENIDSSCLSVGADFSLPQRHDRKNRSGGGVAVWIRQNFSFKVWSDLKDEDHETLWLTVWSNRMPRSCSRIILGVVYHVNNTREGHWAMAGHIINAVDHIRRIHPYSCLIITGDFNRFPDYLISSQLQVSQLVKNPTRDSALLDKLFTDKPVLYPECSIASPIGNSDHSSIIAHPDTWRYDKGQVTTVFTRVCGHNENVQFATELSSVCWRNLYFVDDVSLKVKIFTETLSDLYEKHFPLKAVQRHSCDKPWVTDQYRSLISQRQTALKSGNFTRFRELRTE